MKLPKVNQISIKDALKREKSKFQQGIWNAHTLKGKTFHELNKLAESVVKGNFDGLRERTNYYRIREICPMLQRGMVHGSTQVFLIFFLGRKSVENIPTISAIGHAMP